MNLDILLPNKVFAKHKNVLRVIVETLEGSYGILPNRRDCTAALAPGILTYEIESGKEIYIAIDQGIVVKKGNDVLVSVRQAIQGIGLSQLREAIKAEFLTLDEKQQEIRFAMDKLESSFLQRLTEFSTGAR
ncbi:F0F1 ATP synthase subunit epsilon [Paraglaciecola sp. MB-3u-78]|uniref:F0F1 ATP synthase subunit epsilon n=1 Tax=Paraglaciecola sp. MB-3u-78 TaxID=2058332 RepID=UPI000C31E3CF|nr:F0F1 ATP synthase subunit epsilon [Paraglaciecola sp. MB-3u-78]PKG99596.1 F0F1 ATP synthase subunit epsilon [Paraglaciecola sp. MB-3u-78]